VTDACGGGVFVYIDLSPCKLVCHCSSTTNCRVDSNARCLAFSLISFLFNWVNVFKRHGVLLYWLVEVGALGDEVVLLFVCVSVCRNAVWTKHDFLRNWTSASARRIGLSDKRRRSSYNYVEHPAPRPFSRATSPSLYACLCLLDSRDRGWCLRKTSKHNFGLRWPWTFTSWLPISTMFLPPGKTYANLHWSRFISK